MVVDTAEKALSLLEECKRKRIQLQSIIMMDNDKDVVANLATETGVSVKWFVEVELFGQHSLRDFEVIFLYNNFQNFLQEQIFLC